MSNRRLSTQYLRENCIQFASIVQAVKAVGVKRLAPDVRNQASPNLEARVDKPTDKGGWALWQFGVYQSLTSSANTKAMS